MYVHIRALTHMHPHAYINYGSKKKVKLENKKI